MSVNKYYIGAEIVDKYGARHKEACCVLRGVVIDFTVGVVNVNIACYVNKKSYKTGKDRLQEKIVSFSDITKVEATGWQGLELYMCEMCRQDPFFIGGEICLLD